MEPDIASLAEPHLAPASPRSAPTSPPSPKSQVFEWCARHKVAPPAFEIAAIRDGFEGRAALKLPDGTTLTTSGHTERAKKPLAHALCGELFAALERLLGPESIPPRPPSRRRPKAKAPAAPPAPQESPAEAAARAKAQAKGQAARERHEALRQLLGTVTQDNVRETFAVLKARTYVRSVRIRVTQQRGANLQMARLRGARHSKSCQRADGRTPNHASYAATHSASAGPIHAERFRSSTWTIRTRRMASRTMSGPRISPRRAKGSARTDILTKAYQRARARSTSAEPSGRTEKACTPAEAEDRPWES